jgi:hypothetical protein
VTKVYKLSVALEAAKSNGWTAVARLGGREDMLAYGCRAP